MNLLKRLRNTPPGSAAQARERLRIVIAHERACGSGPDFLPAMRRDIVAVVRRYIAVSADDVTVQFASEDGMSLLEMNVVLSE